MAQGAITSVPINGTNGITPQLTAEELHEIQEYKKILQFRDDILSGKHPRFKIPPHLIRPQANISSPSNSTHRTNVQLSPANPSSLTSNVSPSENRSPATNGVVSKLSVSSIPTKSVQSEINPILLEKSDDLIKAEIQLQRQRLERALREQMDQHRLAQKALLQTSESLPNFDLTEVLQKALAIVHPTTVAEVDASAGSDSFDENSFYSSQHDTPEPFGSPHSHKETLDGQVHGEISATGQAARVEFSNSHISDSNVAMTGTSLSRDNHLGTRSQLQSQSQSQFTVPGLNSYTAAQRPNDPNGKSNKRLQKEAGDN